MPTTLRIGLLLLMVFTVASSAFTQTNNTAQDAARTRVSLGNPFNRCRRSRFGRPMA